MWIIIESYLYNLVELRLTRLRRSTSTSFIWSGKGIEENKMILTNSIIFCMNLLEPIELSGIELHLAISSVDVVRSV